MEGGEYVTSDDITLDDINLATKRVINDLADSGYSLEESELILEHSVKSIGYLKKFVIGSEMKKPLIEKLRDFRAYNNGLMSKEADCPSENSLSEKSSLG